MSNELKETVQKLATLVLADDEVLELPSNEWEEIKEIMTALLANVEATEQKARDAERQAQEVETAKQQLELIAERSKATPYVPQYIPQSVPPTNVQPDWTWYYPYWYYPYWYYQQPQYIQYYSTSAITTGTAVNTAGYCNPITTNPTIYATTSNAIGWNSSPGGTYSYTSVNQ